MESEEGESKGESQIILYISDKNGTSKLNKLTIFDQKWNFWNLVAKFDK